MHADQHAAVQICRSRQPTGPIYDPHWPGMIAIRLEQLGERYVPVDGAKFYTWLQTPDLTWQDVVSMVARKRKQLNKTHNHK